MKKLFLGIVTAALVLSAGTMNAFAAGHGCHYTDANRDGVCDYAGTCAFVDENGDGFCDRAHTICGFVDENEDGICDHCGMGYEESCHGSTVRQSTGTRAGHHGRGHGCGRRCR